MGTISKERYKMKESTKSMLQLLDMTFVPGGFCRFVKRAEEKQKELYDDQLYYNPKLVQDLKYVKAVIVPFIETFKVAAIAITGYMVYDTFFK